jgi:hypothetical protein
MALPGESFAMTLASTVQSSPLTIHDSTAPGSQTYAGSVVLTPTWVFVVNRTVQLYAYVSVQLSSGSSTIASSLLQASATGGSGTANGSWNPFSTTQDGHPDAVLLSTVIANGVRRVAVGTAQQLTVGLRLSTTNTLVEAGLYTGVVTFAARVQ